MKRILAMILVSAMIVGMVPTGAAEEKSAVMAVSVSGGREEPTEKDHDFLSAPTRYWAQENERVNASTGELSYRQTLVDLAGKNGLDLKLDLVFHGNANLYYGEREHDDGEPWWSDWYEKKLNGNEWQNKVDGPYGIGWSFDLPSIALSYKLGIAGNLSSSVTAVRHYQMQGGGSYEIEETGGGYTLKDYPKTDLTIEKLASPYSYQVTAADGRREKFDAEGRIRSISDRWGNEIAFYYYITDDMSGYVLGDETASDYRCGGLSRIVDSAGREIVFTYDSHLVTSPSGKDQRVFYIDLNEGESETRLAWINAESEYAQGQYLIQSITTRGGYNSAQVFESGQTTAFTYEQNEVKCTDEPVTDLTLSSVPRYNTVLNLGTITYQSGLTAFYIYDKYKANNGERGVKEKYRVLCRYERFGEDDTQYRRVDYTYANDYSGFSKRLTDGDAYADPNHLPDGYTYSVSRRENGLTETTTYNHDHLPIKVETRADGTLISTTESVYGAQELPTRKTVTTGQAVRVEEYEYDGLGNVVKAWSPRANGEKGSEHQTTITYHTSYNQIASRAYKRDASHTVVEEYTLTSDGKNIAEKTVKENGVLAEKTGYAYDAYGNVVSEKKYTDTDTYTEIQYDYIDWVSETRPSGWDFEGVYLTGVWSFGDKDIDGEYVTVSTEYEYDNLGRKVKEYDGLWNETGYAYDNNDRLVKITNPDGTSQSFAYTLSSSVNRTTHTDEAGNVTEYHYDPAGNLLEVRDGTSGEAVGWYEYDEFYRVRKEGNVPLATTGHVIAYAYDSQNRMTAKETRNTAETLLAKETWAYDDAVTSEYLVTTHTVVGDLHAPSVVNKEYVNRYGELEKIGAVTGEEEFFTTYAYDYVGNKVSEKSALADQMNWTGAYTSKWEYDHAGRVVREYDAADNFVSYEYDMAGQMIKTADKAANASSNPYYTTYEYDGLGNVICETVPQDENQSKVTKYKYDANGRVLEERVLSDTNQYRTTSYTYDERGNVLSTSQGGVTTAYTYDDLGNLLTSTTGGVTTSYTYDRFGNCLTVTSYGQTEHYEYDINSVLTKYTDKGGIWNSYVSDGLGRVTETQAPGENARLVTYTLSGQIREIGEAGTPHTILRSYNDRGLLMQETYPGQERNYVYDIAGNRREFTFRNMAESAYIYLYNYNDLGQLSAVHDAQTLSDAVIYTYDANGRVIKEDKGGVESEFDRNYDGSVKMMEVTRDAAPTDPRYRTYTYYPDGNVKTEQTSETCITTYVYDARNQLVSESTTEGASTTYTYNALGNRVSKTTVENGVTDVVQYNYNSRGLLSEAVSSQNGTTDYGYDDSGNLLAIEGGGYSGVFTFDGYGQMVYAIVNGVTADYNYRPDGLRSSKIVGGVTTQYAYDGDHIAAELDANGNTTATYLRGLSLVKLTRGTEFWSYVQDPHGDVVGMVDATGQLTEADYDAYGNGNESTLPSTNPFGYCGEYFDTETGFVYLRARYYDPNIGRFISEDPARDGINWYAYCNNNPMAFVDPSGLAVTDEDRKYLNSSQIARIEQLTNEYNSAKEKGDYVGMNRIRRETVEIRQSGYDYEDTYDYTHGGVIYTYEYVYETHAESYSNAGIFVTEKGYVYILNLDGTGGEQGRQADLQSIGDNDFVVLDYRDSENPNMQIRRSYGANRNVRLAVIDVLLLHERNSPSEWNRSRDSMENEWWWHNQAYKVGHSTERTAHVDLDNFDEINYPRLWPWGLVKQ